MLLFAYNLGRIQTYNSTYLRSMMGIRILTKIDPTSTLGTTKLGNVVNAEAFQFPYESTLLDNQSIQNA